MVRAYRQRSYRRLPFKKGSSFRRRTTSYKGRRLPKIVFSNRNAKRMRTRPMGFQKFVYFENIRPAQNISQENAALCLSGQANAIQVAIPPAAVGPPMPFVQEARDAHFGPAYALGAGGAVDGNQNPTTNGDGVLAQLALRDPVMDSARWDYSSYALTAEEITDAWDARNNGGGFVAVPSTAVYFKGVKINLITRSLNSPSLCYLSTRKSLNHPFNIREQVGKIKGYYPTIPSKVAVAAGAGRLINWTIPEIVATSTVFTRIKVTVYYKVKKVFAN